MQTKKHKKKTVIFLLLAAILLIIAAAAGGIYYSTARKNAAKEQVKDLLAEYMEHIEKQEYEEMYAMIAPEESGNVDQETFTERNSRIYEGIEVANLKLENLVSEEDEEEKGYINVSYDTSFDTVAGAVSFHNEVTFCDTDDGYKILWKDSLIFPNLEAADKVRVSTDKAERGKITDRNGYLLAGKGTAWSVGIVPGKLEDREESLEKIAKLLEMNVETIEKKLAASWVKEDSFVPVGMIHKAQELNLNRVDPDEEDVEAEKCKEALLEIPGVKLSETEVRYYSLGEAASHLIGYVQEVTAEDLEKHAGEGYSSGSVIGKSGMESLFETELKGQDGHEIKLVDEDGQPKEIIASIPKQDGEDIQLTIDAELQKSLYEQFQEDRGCSVAMNPYTGEVLALVSTPSYNNNDFILGMSSEKWTALNEDEDGLLYNRFRQIWCPGSTMKPIMAAIGLKTGVLDPNEDFGSEGKSWQKDSSWGNYHVTTLTEYSPVTMKNAIIRSDNIYFAKVALKIGAEDLMQSLDDLGFNQKLPFEISMNASQYSNTETIETEIQLADSGYGQGQILMNPLHLATIYTAFLNEGNIVKPYLQYQESTENAESTEKAESAKSAESTENAEGAETDFWISEAFSADMVDQVLESMVGVIETEGTSAHAAQMEGVTLAGKTGTAEVKATKEDTEGTEIGWFAVCTADPDEENPVLLVSMVEDVKNLGGTSYVVKKDKAVLEKYLR